MTNGWIDIKNTDMMLIMGGNPAENHPCGFKWAIEAKRNRNAKLISVDPRFTRTSANADLFLQIRAGTDIAFLGGLINYALQNDRVAKEYLVNYTNAAFVIKEGFKLPDDGLYSGFDAEKHTYNKSSWNYEEGGDLTGKDAAAQAAASAAAAAKANAAAAHAAAAHPPAAPSASPSAQKPGMAQPGVVAPPALLPPNVAYDLSLQHPRCVYQLLKQQYSRYTPEMVERITGIPQDQLLKAYDLYTSVRKDGDMKKASTIIYAVGWTQHTFGTQIIRTAAMVQLLMGNVGRTGGGVNALRGHSNIQGSTDMGGAYDILPGYLKIPQAVDLNLEGYLKRTTTTPAKPAAWDSFNYWGNTPKFLVSFLKAMYGNAATKENNWAFDWVPKVDRRYAWADLWNGMYEGKVKGLFAFGMNGVMIGPNTRKNIDALKKADFLVVCEIYPDETSSFWQAPGTTAEGMKQINTTVYRLPGCGFAEKDGSFTNSARWLQWKQIALPPAGDAQLDQAIVARIFLKVRDLYKREGGKFPDPVLNATWSYTDPRNPSLAEVTKEINGKALADLNDPNPKSQLVIKSGQQLPGFAWLKDDGTTSCGNWIYCGSWTDRGPPGSQ
jgi:anaerobic selenocysteine-containing dehydrogenase